MVMKVLTESDEIEENYDSDSSLEGLPTLLVEESPFIAAKTKIKIQIKFVG